MVATHWGRAAALGTAILAIGAFALTGNLVPVFAGIALACALLCLPAFFAGLWPSEQVARLSPHELVIRGYKIRRERVVRIIQSQTDICVVEKIGDWHHRRILRFHHPAHEVASLARVLRTWADPHATHHRLPSTHRLEALDPEVTPDGIVISLPPNPWSNLGIGAGAAVLFGIGSTALGFGIDGTLLLWAGLFAPFLLLAMNQSFNRPSLRIGPDALELEGHWREPWQRVRGCSRRGKNQVCVHTIGGDRLLNIPTTGGQALADAIADLAVWEDAEVPEALVNLRGRTTKTPEAP